MHIITSLLLCMVTSDPKLDQASYCLIHKIFMKNVNQAEYICGLAKNFENKITYYFIFGLKSNAVKNLKK